MKEVIAAHESRHPGRWSALDDGRVQCDLCPRECRLVDGQRGFCFVRAREGERLIFRVERPDAAHAITAAGLGVLAVAWRLAISLPR